MYVNRCVSCGQEIPEGRQVCILCELGISPAIIKAKQINRKKKSKNSENSSSAHFSSVDISGVTSSWKEEVRDKVPLLIVGAGGFGRVVLEYAEKDNYFCAFIDDNVPVGSRVDGVEVIGRIEDLPKFKDYINLIVAIGDNNVRERVYTLASKYGFVFPNIIADSAYVSLKASVGTGCIILNNVVIQSGVKAGNGLILNPGVELHNDSFVDDYAIIYTNSVILSNAHIGKRVWIGSTITVDTGEYIPDDAVIYDKSIQAKPKTFEELWGKIIAANKLPDMAALMMQKSFSKATKELLLNSHKSGSELADLLNRIIKTIDDGSTMGINELVQRELK